MEKRKFKDIEKAKTLIGTILHSFEPVDMNSLDEWIAVMYGSPGSPYEDGLFTIHMKFFESHPYGAPTFTFKTPIFHPNICPKDGKVCRPIFHDHWSAPIYLDKCFQSIDSLMRDYSLDMQYALNLEAANMIENDQEAFYKKARFMTKKFAM